MGKRVLVTGAATGIGRGIALALAARGARVAVHFGPGTSADDVLEAVAGAGAPRAPLTADLRRTDECTRVVSKAAELLGGLDGLVNNAADTRAVPFEHTGPETYDEIFSLNVRAPFFCTQAVLPHLRQAGGGSIVNISSVHAQGGFRDHSAYSATKGALEAWTKALAIELAPDAVRVNAVAPGLIEVERYYEWPNYDSEVFGGHVPLRRVGRPADVAAAVCFLCSDESAFVTGQTITVDGGTAARLALPDRR